MPVSRRLRTTLLALAAVALGAPSVGVHGQERLGTREQRDALVDELLDMSSRREAWSPFKESALGYDPLAEMEAVRSDVVNAATEEELFYALVKMSNARRDSHLSVTAVPDGIAGPSSSEMRAPIHVLPDYTDMAAPTFFVSGVDEAGLGGLDVDVGDLIVSINGRSASEYVTAFRAWTRHSSPQGLFWNLARDVPLRLPTTAPWMYRATLELELQKDSGERVSVSLPYLEPDRVEIAHGEGDLYPGFTTVMERFNFHVLRPDDGRPVVLLQWLDFEYELIQDVMDLMEYAQVEGILGHMLVIDVTDSSGGSRGAYAIQRLVSRPFRTTYGNIRISDVGAAMIREWAEEEDDVEAPEVFGLNESGSWLHEWARTDAMDAVNRGDEYTTATPFKLAHLPRQSEGILEPARVHFSGPIAIIGGPRGGSHLDQFVSMFADNDLAFTIGMPTGGYSNTWEAEEVITFPGTDQPVVNFMWNVGHTLRPNGDILEGNAVEPEVYVPLTRENFRTYHRDLLAAALQRLAGTVSYLERPTRPSPEMFLRPPRRKPASRRRRVVVYSPPSGQSEETKTPLAARVATSKQLTPVFRRLTESPWPSPLFSNNPSMETSVGLSLSHKKSSAVSLASMLVLLMELPAS